MGATRVGATAALEMVTGWKAQEAVTMEEVDILEVATLVEGILEGVTPEGTQEGVTLEERQDLQEGLIGDW